jgi:hypothetical protein
LKIEKSDVNGGSPGEIARRQFGTQIRERKCASPFEAGQERLALSDAPQKRNCRTKRAWERQMFVFNDLVVLKVDGSTICELAVHKIELPVHKSAEVPLCGVKFSFSASGLAFSSEDADVWAHCRFFAGT